mmetsp:Transcript_20766/g.60693  ORF Transcript_20766/g.60693 Transcript_20766/m.60693 type:complete len:108 (+) Transcript_20766:518-841(+)
MVDRSTGELVGTAGFRDLAGGVAEFGIIVRRKWQRQGFCAEAFECNVDFARTSLDCHRVAAATSDQNSAMLNFLTSRGMEVVGRHEDKGVTWVDLARDIKGLAIARQ